MGRITIPEYVMRLAETAALRSEDPYTKVGAVALTEDNRVIATAYNGLPPKFTASNAFWDNRDKRLKFMTHAEQNLCSLFKRGEASKVALTLLPCGHCLMTLIAHGIHTVWYKETYKRDPSSLEIAEVFPIKLIQLGEDYKELE